MTAFLDRMDMRGALALLIVSSVVSLMFVMAIRAPDSDAFKILMGGVMTVGFAGVVAWFFGSSSGSAMKDEALATTASAQTATIASQSAALAASVPAPVTTTKVDAQAGTAETETKPAQGT